MYSDNFISFRNSVVFELFINFKPICFLQCFDTVGLVIWPVKIVPEMTYYVSSGTLNPTHSPLFFHLECTKMVWQQDSALPRPPSWLQGWASRKKKKGGGGRTDIHNFWNVTAPCIAPIQNVSDTLHLPLFPNQSLTWKSVQFGAFWIRYRRRLSCCSITFSKAPFLPRLCHWSLQ